MSTQQEVQAKHDFIVNILKRNRLESPVEIVKAIQKKFGSGVSKQLISSIREEEFGVKLGPGGFAHEVASVTPQASPPKAVMDSQDRLNRLIADLQAEMKLQHVASLSIPSEGPAEAVQTVRRQLAVPPPSVH